MLDDAIAQFGQFMNEPAFDWCKMLPASQLLYAQSISATLNATGNRHSFPLQWLSTHTHACNFVTPTGAIIALVTPQHGNGPFHIVLPGPLPASLTRDHEKSGQWRQGSLWVGTLQIALQQAIIWQPDLPALHHPFHQATHLLHELAHHSPPSALHRGAAALVQRAQQGIALLQSGLTQGDEDKVGAGVTRLAGLGPGLTPAGDDFLVGLLAALHACRLHAPATQPEINNCCRLIAQTAAPHTTRLSAQWLHHAGQGHFGEAWHHLIDALNRNESAAITATAHRILTTGATSGIDAMSGFLFGVSLLQPIIDS